MENVDNNKTSGHLMAYASTNSFHVMHFNASHEFEYIMSEVNNRIFRVAVGIYGTTIILFMVCMGRCRWSRAWTACMRRIGRSCAT